MVISTDGSPAGRLQAGGFVLITGRFFCLDDEEKSMKITKRLLAIFVILLIILMIIFWNKFFGSGGTPAIRNEKGDIVPGSIAVLDKIDMGGMDQGILIRGRDIDNPILLWLHGGPGSSQMPITHEYDKELEKEFVMVHWDQRGAGKSNPPGFDEKSMTYARFIADGHQLTGYLKERFNKEKIYLLGHSWGSQLGIELAGRYPEDYHAYIGVSQVVNQERSERIAYSWLVEQIKEKGNRKDLKKLESLDGPPFIRHEEFVTFIQMVNAYGGSFDLPFSRLLWISLKSPEYTFRDYFAWMAGSNRGSGKMWAEEAYRSFDAMEKYPELDVPVFFFMGRNDYNTPLKAARVYYENLIAPQGKRLIIFENSAHTPFLAEPEKFVRELIGLIR